jgi:hypothetical protein
VAQEAGGSLLSQRKFAAIAIAVVALAAVVASAELNAWPFGQGGSGCPRGGSQAPCFYEEPVVDVIMPAVGSSGNTTNPNRVLNVTAGSDLTLEVEVYPTVALNASMSFSSYLVSVSGDGSSGMPGGDLPSATFQPSTLTIPAYGHGVTQMLLAVPAGTEPGTYAAVVTATDASNSTQSWGLFFQLEVL